MRLKIGLKQTEVARNFGFSQAYLYQIENEKRKCPNKLYQELMAYYNDMDQSEGLEAKFDYVRVRLPTHNVERVINQILLMDIDQFHCKPTGLYGYLEMYEYDSIRVLQSEKGNERGILIELAGHGCRNYEYILNELDQRWLDFFIRCLLVDGVIKRIDVAIDDYIEYFSLADVVKKRKKMEIVTSFRKSRIVDSTSMDEGLNEGLTAYFGTRNSLVYFCFYQKNYEIAHREKIPVEAVDVKNRYETRFQQEKAQKFIEHYVEDTYLLRSARSVISQQLMFTETKRDGTICEWAKWRKFLGATEYVDLSMEPIKPSFERKLRWLKNYCSQAMEVVRIVGDQEGKDYFAELLSDIELNERNKKVIEWQLAQNMELLSCEGQLIAQDTGEILC
ncbi:replication initiation factor domain-containing protein [Melissococcus plutonius]